MTRHDPPRTVRTRPLGPVLAAALLCLPLPRVVAAEGGETGEKIYRLQCARCHGGSGQGTEEEYPDALVGDRSVAQLARYIEKRMPEDDPGTCIGEDAQAVAAYIYDAFYSPLAQARNRPARVELARLTVRQYRNVVTDLIGSFRSPEAPDDRPGLKGEYFKGRRFRNNERVLERVDAGVDFDFGVGAPEEEGFEPSQFSIKWEGTVRPPESGKYEFVVRTDHALRLYVNDGKKALIDGWVKSGDMTEYRGSLELMGGRAYPLRLEFSKAKQGVDDSKKQKGPPPEVHAGISLRWVPPGRAEEVIPARALSPGRAPEGFVLAAPFPPDDRSMGYERGTSISRAWDEATTEAAIEVAGYVAERLNELAGTRKEEAKLRAFAATFVERAFRRPLTDEVRARYVARQFEATSDPEMAIKRVVLLALKSPRFLYREVEGGADAYTVAARLSFALWDSLPDEPLRTAAAEGRLASREGVAEQAGRLVADPRARAKLREFFLGWMRVEQPPDLGKDPERYAEFSRAIASDLRTSLELFLDDVAWGEGSDFRRLLTEDALYLNGRLAQFYGADLPADAPFRKVAPRAGEWAGILTHPYLMASFAYTDTSSPIHRGVFLARNVLGRSLRPPPNAFSPLAPDLHPSLNTRERVALQTSPTACQDCHAMINPLGFALEHFDAVGRWRDEEKGRPIDASGWYEPTSGSDSVRFDGARSLGTFLAASEEVHAAFVQQLFEYLVKQPVRAYGEHALSDLCRSFADHDYSIRRLLAEIATTTALADPAGPAP